MHFPFLQPVSNKQQEEQPSVINHEPESLSMEGGEFLDDALRMEDLAPTYRSPADALSDLRKRGYEADFNFEELPYGLYCGDLDMRLDPEDYHVDEIYRFGVEEQTTGCAVVYAITSAQGIKGIVVVTTPDTEKS
jgi:hypothetical protein